MNPGDSLRKLAERITTSMMATFRKCRRPRGGSSGRDDALLHGLVDPLIRGACRPPGL